MGNSSVSTYSLPPAHSPASELHHHPHTIAAVSEFAANVEQV